MIPLDATRSNEAMQHMTNTVDELKGDMDELMGDLDDIMEDLDEIKDDMGEIKDDVGEIKDDMGDIKDDVVEIKCSCSVTLLPPQWRLNLSPGNQIEQDVRKWFSPPDPSVNYNTACEAYQKGTAAWFFQGSIFKEWELIDSLLWVHGKRAYLLSFTTQVLIVSLP
jgi:hypothetical protein